MKRNACSLGNYPEKSAIDHQGKIFHVIGFVERRLKRQTLEALASRVCHNMLAYERTEYVDWTTIWVQVKFYSCPTQGEPEGQD
jgi:hypothetical protein